MLLTTVDPVAAQNDEFSSEPSGRKRDCPRRQWRCRSSALVEL